ncbi:MAG: murein biosynthesis integral membrane protein MurJ [Alphaproteobacteria bacterium]
MLRHVFTIGSFTLFSRITGFLRDALIASFLGVSPLTDAFFVAFKLPNFFRRFFAEGAFSSAFVPLFSGMVARQGLAAATRYAGQILTLMIGALLTFLLLVECWMPEFLALLAPGFSQTPERFQDAVALARIAFPYIFFVSLVALVSGVLNTLQKFAAAAFSPVLLNVFMIGSLFILTPFVPTLAHGLVWSVLFAGALQLAWVYGVCIKHGIYLRPHWHRLSPELRKFFKLLLPAAMGAGIFQINFFVDMLFASLLPTGSISYLFYADRLNQLPLGVIGIAISTALLPKLSKELSLQHHEEALVLQNRSLELGMILTIPAALGLILLAFPLVKVLFERGAFQPNDVLHTSQALVAFASGLPAYVLVKIFSTSFFARQDTKTPVWIGAGIVLLNIMLIFFLYKPLAHVGIALATALSAWVNAGCLVGVLWHQRHFKWEKRLSQVSQKLLLCCGILVLFLELSRPVILPLFEGDLFFKILGLGCAVGGGGLCFLLTAAIFKLFPLPLRLKARNF